MSIDATAAISKLALSSGGYAMVALDQRESMRTMFVDKGHSATDDDLTEFKREATTVLAPYASAILMDSVFSSGADLDLGDTRLILAVDDFDQPAGGPLRASRLDPTITPARVTAFGAHAVKQLVLFQADGDPADRARVISEFMKLCGECGVPGIVEGVIRAPAEPTRTWDRDEAIVAAAAEAAGYRPDLYKAEVPAYGQGNRTDLERSCRRITDALNGTPWVVLSSGVAADDFPEAVRAACRGGASGFLAGRAIWADCVGAPLDELRTRAVGRLRHLATIVEETVTP